jgi:type 1 glutamine amidotransferase
MKIPIRLLMSVTVGISLLWAQAPPGRGRTGTPTESVRPPASHKISLALPGLMGWHVGLPATAFRDLTFIEAAVKTDAAGLGAIEGFNTQKASPEIAKNLDYNLTPDERTAIQNKLQALGMRLYAYHVDKISADDRKPLQFAKDMGADVVVTPADPASLAALDQLAAEIGINIAVESRNPRNLMSALEGRSSHIGIAADSAAGDRLMVLELRGSPAGRAQLFLDIARKEPAPQEQPDQCSNCGRPHGGERPLFIALDSPAGIEKFETAVRPAMGYRVEQISKVIPITSFDKVPAADRQKLEAALPKQAAVQPKKPRKLLVIDLCPAGGYYHTTIAYANFAIQSMGRSTGAYEPVFSNDLNNLKYPKIKQFDAVFLNSVVGEVFPDPEVLNGLIRFVREGGGVAGIHGSTYASMDLPEYSELMGAADGPHRVETATLKVDDPASPIAKQFGGQDIVHTDEFYHFLPTGPFSRDKLHVLLSIDAARSDLSAWKVRPDNDYGSVWIKSYGKGRVFNCAMGHTPQFYEKPEFEQMILNAIQFVTGDLAADTTPSAKLSAKK